MTTDKRRLVTTDQAASCYFRTSVPSGQRKALVQITERCNLSCAHCFVSATKHGDTMSIDQITELVIPRLAACCVSRVTLTGGEPFVHPDLLHIVKAFRAAGMGVGICTNATMITDHQIAALAEVGGVHLNVSLDGFRAASHGRFRGDRASFAVTVATVRRLGATGLLQGLLCTPNNLAEDEEYRDLCAFAVESGAEYVLMNPLSSMGRGVKAKRTLAAAEQRMLHIYELTTPFHGSELDIVHIRFPNIDKPLAGCEAGTIVYVFTRGDVTVCPYLVFAARTAASQHDPAEFLVGNILTDADLAQRLDAYRFHDRYKVGANPSCGGCTMASACGKGCPAAVIARGQRIGAVDDEVCPVTTRQRWGLPVLA
jgi:radical SAM protein with 4Fe4S-binding SPASM domain